MKYRSGLSLCLLTLLMPLSVFAQDSTWETSLPECQILDNSVKPVWSVNLGYIPDRRFSNHGKAEMIELDADYELGYYRDVFTGDIDLNVDLDLTILPDSARLDLPDQLIALALDVGWTWRYLNGSAIQVRIAPGIYSDFEEFGGSAFSIPMSIAGIYALNNNLSGIAGLQFRPSWELEVMPIVGAVWEISDQARLEAMLPESKLTVIVDDLCQVFGGIAWNNTSYAIRDQSAYDRKQITFEDWRTKIGAIYLYSDGIHLVGELGYVFNREVKFERVSAGDDRSINIDSTPYIRIGIAGPF